MKNRRLIYYFSLAFVSLLFLGCAKQKIQDQGLKQAYVNTWLENADGKSDEELLSADLLVVPDVNTIDSFAEINGNEHLASINIGYKPSYILFSKEESIKMGYPAQFEEYVYSGEGDEPKKVSVDKMEQIQRELGDIIKTCPNFKTLRVNDANGILEFSSLDFLCSDPDKLQNFYTYNLNAADYSSIYGCNNLVGLDLVNAYNFSDDDLKGIGKLKKLEVLNISDTDVETAEEILNLGSLKRLYIKGTPLEKNEEEIRKLEERFPELLIE